MKAAICFILGLLAGIALVATYINGIIIAGIIIVAALFLVSEIVYHIVHIYKRGRYKDSLKSGVVRRI